MAAAAEEAVVVVDIGGRTTKKKTDDDDDDDVEGAADGEAEDLLELCEEDVWGTMDGDEEERDDLDAERASVSSDDEDEDDDEGSHHDVSRRRDHFAMELTPRVPSATYGSLPAWRHSSLPRAIVRPPGRAADAETAGKRGSPSPSDARTAKAARAGGGIATLLASSLPDDDDAMFIPPHVYASTYGARGTGSVSERAFWGDAASGMDQLLLGGSVVSGRGHTLKGRDALKMRTAILRQTGFVEPTMTALDAMNGGAGSFEGERVPRVPTPAIAPRMGGGTTSPTT